MSCLKTNLGSLDVIGLSEEALGAHNIDDMIKNIIDSIYANASSYALSEEESLKPLEYKESIDNKLKELMQKIAAMDSSIPELLLKEGETHYEIIKENLKSHFYEKGNITREEEVELSAVIDGQLMSKEEIAALRLNKVLDTFFSGNNAAKETFKKEFARELGLSVVIRIGLTLEDSNIVDNESSLNDNILSFLEDKYLTIYRYLNSLGMAKGIPNSMFRNNELLGTYFNTLLRFYNLIVHKSKIGTLEDSIEQGWKQSLEGKSISPVLEAAKNLKRIISNYKNGYKVKVRKDQETKLLNIIEDFISNNEELTVLLEGVKQAINLNSVDADIQSNFNKIFNYIVSTSKSIPSLYEAVNAYLSIVYFDKLSQESIGKYISIDKDLPQPINIDSDGIETYKYKFGKDTENRVHGWQIDVRDALKEMGNFSKFLISSIPIDDTYLTPVNYLDTFTTLFGNILHFFGGDKHLSLLYNAMSTFNTDPVNKMREVLSLIENYASVRSVVAEYLNPYEMKVLHAVNEYVFRSNTSLFNIEASYNKSKGLKNRYPIVESLAALIASSVEMLYLQTTYDYNDGVYKVETKKKYQTLKLRFDMLGAINISNQNMEDTSVPYKFVKKSPSEYIIDLGNTLLTVNVDLLENSYGILTKLKRDVGISMKVTDKKSGAVTDLDTLFKTDISTRTKRQRLIESKGEQGQQFMDVLLFVDFITGTTFTATLDGLLEFELFKNNFNKSSLEAVATAVRGLVVKDIHAEFKKQVEAGKYTTSLIAKFIEDSGIYNKNIIQLSEKDKLWSSIWEPSILGPDLTTVSNAQQWLDDYVTVKLIMSGEISKANTKNLAGDSIPNYGLAFMGSNFHALVSDYQHARNAEDSPFDSLPLDSNIFMLNPAMVIGSRIDTDVKLADGTSKLVKGMTEGELFYHSIVDKFLIPLVLLSVDKHMIIQPTTYSDKTKFVNYAVRLMIKGKDLSKASIAELEQMYIDSIGKSYKSILQKVLSDYARIFDLVPMYTAAYKTDEAGFTIGEDPVAILQMIRTIDAKLRTMTEYELIALTKEKGLSIEILADTHFRANGNRKTRVNGKTRQHLAFNESLYHYAYNVYSKQGMHKRLANERRKFLNSLLKNKVTIDGIRMEYDERRHVLIPSADNIWGKAILYFDASTNWVTKDGTLVLARVNGEDITSHDLIPEGTNVELNPILDKYFTLHSLLGNNLRMMLTGSEINHKNKHLGKMNPASIISLALNPENKSTGLLFQLLEIQDAVTAVAKEIQIKNPNDLWATLSFTDVERIIEKILDAGVKNKVRKAIDKALYEVESAGQGSQLKRNVIIPATMRYYTQNSLRGIASTMRVAVMDDIQAAVFNFTGVDGSVDAHDGAAYINPITSILENWSLQENEVGTVKKPIWHYYDKEHMTSSLVKFAAHTMTNNMMLQSSGARVNMLDMFRKMANNSWELIPEIGIGRNILTLAKHRPSGVITFTDLTGGNDIYYKGAAGSHYKIVDFGYDEDNKVYYTDEIRVNSKGQGSGSVRKYHYFTADKSEHIISTKILDTASTGYHTMRSIYEAHQVFGGINSESLISDGKETELQYSEASNYVVANLVNNVAIESALAIKARKNYEAEMLKYDEVIKAGKTMVKPKLEKTFDQTYYVQPLKTLMIDYLCNNSAIKNGAGNRNSAARFENDEDLDYITLGTEYYGIQMDADHEADEAEMTEFSQVISALDAGGRMHDYVKGIYQALGQIAMEEAKLEMDSIVAYQQNPTLETRDALYDIIGRTIINNISTSRGQAGLAEAIIKQIKRRFSLSNTHKMDDLKIPFSDPNIYSNVLSTYASIITNKSIRKKYPGLGAVLSPGYNIMMIYDIDGRQYQYKDLIKEANSRYKDYAKKKKAGVAHEDDTYYEALFTESAEAIKNGLQLDTESWNKKLVDAYLLKKTDEYNRLKWKFNVTEVPGQNPDWDLHTDEFMPTDNVGVLYAHDGKQEWINISLDKIDDYYLFKADPRAFILDKTGIPGKIIQFRKNIHKSRNLAPTKIYWSYNDGKMDRTANIFDSIHLIKNFAKVLKKKLDKAATVEDKLIYQQQLARVNAYIARLEAAGIKEYSSTQELLDELSKGTWQGKPIVLTNTPAELIMSNIYQARFGLGVQDSMADVIKDGPKAPKQHGQVHQDTDPGFYDFVMTKANGQHSYISLDRDLGTTVVGEDEELPDISYKETFWKDKHRKSHVEGKVVNDVYATTKDHRLLFKIGRDIIREDLEYNETGKFFHEKGDVTRVVPDTKLTYENGLVKEYIEFVTKHIVTDKGRKHTVYNINTDKLKRAMNPRSENIKLKDGTVLTPEQALNLDMITYVQGLLLEIYEADSYEIFTVNDSQISQYNLKKIKGILAGYAKKDTENRSVPFEYNPELTRYLTALSETISKIPDKESEKRADLKFEDGVIKFVKGKDPGYVKTILTNRDLAYRKSLGNKKYYSFLRSRSYTASRIPAQTLQSFMNMMQVGYSEEGSNLAYVSHWQTWLQGSDYDIDKAYIMGLAFDDNGNYIGWSSLFDYYNLETIKASEYLPLPKLGVHIEESEDGVDIAEEAKIITEADTKLKETLEKPLLVELFKIARLKAYASIFNKLGSGTKVKGASSEILKALNNHNATKLPTEVRAMALRNFISTHIQNTIQNVRNAADSYVPVDMDDLRDAAENSPKGAEALELTLMNPLSIYTMQYQNMTGKNVIAISATGQKAAFMWMYYLNDVINSAKGWQGTYVSTLEDLANIAEKEALVLSENKVYIKFNDKWIPDNSRSGYDYVINSAGQIEALENTDFKFTRFQFDTTRIKGRSKAKKGQPIEPEKVTTTTLPDVNTERLMDLALLASIDGGKLKSSIPVDIIISLMISAATDNAKELILAKINAGSKLAKCYLFLMTMGYDINDIVKFMTSNAVSWIDSLSDPNIFLSQNLRIDEAITEVLKYLKNYEANKNTESFEDEFGQAIKGSAKKLKLLKSIIPSNLTPALIQEALLDIEEFKYIMLGTDEFSAFGQLLSINQGLPGKTEDLEAKLTKIKRIMTKREKDLGILGDNGVVTPGNIPNITDLSRYSDIYGGLFNTTRWLLDKEYRRRVSEYYDKLKVSLNIFAAADYLPHFDSMFQLLGGECTVNEFSVKSRILSACLEKISKEAPKVFLDDKYYSRILGFASLLTMQQFLIDNDFEFPVAGPIINSNRTISHVKNGKINLSTEEGIASFKYYFENVVIPGLRAGTYGDFSDKEKAEIRGNAFIAALIRGNDRDVPLWKVNVNLSADSAYTRIQLNNFSKAMQQLTNYKIGDLSVADWFALYNLVVNKNQYGSDRLTKIFEKFVNDFDSKGNNIINRYLKYIGDIDYANTSLDNILNFTAMDMFISQARIVSSTQGQTDPVVIVYEDKVPKYYKNVGFGKYQAIPDDEIMATITGESIEQKLHRFYLLRAYFVLGKPYSSFLSRILNQLDESPVYGIAELMKTSKLFLDMICV